MVCVSPSVWRKEVRCQRVKCIFSLAHRASLFLGCRTGVLRHTRHTPRNRRGPVGQMDTHCIRCWGNVFSLFCTRASTAPSRGQNQAAGSGEPKPARVSGSRLQVPDSGLVGEEAGGDERLAARCLHAATQGTTRSATLGGPHERPPRLRRVRCARPLRPARRTNANRPL